MLTDLLLAIAHHLLMFALLAVLVTEMMMIRQGVTGSVIRRLAAMDSAYGVIALLILVVGFGRVFFGDKGSGFYLSNWVFWAKIAAFVAVGVLSILPTTRIVASRNALRADAAFVPPAAETATVRRMMHYEGAVFLLIPIFAALMARGYGL